MVAHNIPLKPQPKRINRCTWEYQCDLTNCDSMLRGSTKSLIKQVKDYVLHASGVVIDCPNCGGRGWGKEWYEGVLRRRPCECCYLGQVSVISCYPILGDCDKCTYKKGEQYNSGYDLEGYGFRGSWDRCDACNGGGLRWYWKTEVKPLEPFPSESLDTESKP